MSLKKIRFRFIIGVFLTLPLQAYAGWTNKPDIAVNGSLSLVSDSGGQAKYAVPISINISGTHQTKYDGCSGNRISPYFAYGTYEPGAIYGANPLVYAISKDNATKNGVINWTDEDGITHSDGNITLSGSSSGSGDLATSGDIASETVDYGHECILASQNTNGYLVLTIPHDSNQPLLKSVESVALHLWGRGKTVGGPQSSTDDFGTFTFAPDVTRAETACQVDTDDFHAVVNLSGTTPSAQTSLGTTEIDCNRDIPVNLTASVSEPSDDNLTNTTITLGYTDYSSGQFIPVDGATPVTTTEIGVPLLWTVNVAATNTNTPPPPGSYSRTAIINISYD